MFTNFAVIIFLPLISQDGTDDGTGVLDHHFSSLDVPFAEKASPVNLRSKRITEHDMVKFMSIKCIFDVNKVSEFYILFCFPLPVNAYCFFGSFLQVSESHRHGKLAACGSPGGHRQCNVSVNMASATLLPFSNFRSVYFVVCRGLKYLNALTWKISVGIHPPLHQMVLLCLGDLCAVMPGS